jgi:hypothetical protein
MLISYSVQSKLKWRASLIGFSVFRNWDQNSRDPALRDCGPEDKAGILTLSDRVRNIRFVQGLYSKYKQLIVRNRDHDNFDEIAETALEEKSDNISKNKTYKSSNTSSDNLESNNCGRNNHVTCRCILKGKKDVKGQSVFCKA